MTLKWQKETPSEQPKNEKEELKEKFKKYAQMFIDESTQGNPNIFSGYRDTDDYFDVFQKHLWKKWELDTTFNDFLALNKDFCKNTLKSLLTAYGVQRNQLLKSIETSFWKQFNLGSLDPAQIGELQGAYKKLSNTQLKDLVVSQFVREKFVKKVLRFSTDEYNLFLQHNKQDEQLLKAIFGNIPPNITNDAEAMTILKDLQNLSHLSADDLQKFLWYLDESGKLAFVEYFLPTITLKEALELQLITQADKKNLLRQTLRENGITNPAQILEMIKDLDESLVYISTHSLQAQITTKFIDESFLHRVLKEYHLGAENVIDALKIENFDMLKSKILSDKNIPDTIKHQFQNFKEGNYVNFTYTKWNTIQDNYFLIGNVATQIELINITAWANKVMKGDLWTPQPMSYEDLYRNIKTISSKDTLGFQVIAKDAMNTLRKETLENVLQWSTVQTKEELKKFLKDHDPDYSWDDEKFMMVCDPRPNATDTSKPQQKALNKEEIYKVTKMDDNGVYIAGQWYLSYEEFAQGFEERKPKRHPLITNSQVFFDTLKLHPNYSQSLKDIELKKWHFQYQESAQKKVGNIEYFHGKWNLAIKITKLENGSVSFQEWEFSEQKSWWKTKTTFKVKHEGKHIDYNDFYIYMTNQKLTPYDQNLKDAPIKDVDDWSPKRGILKAWWAWASFMEIIAWGKQILDSIESSLKEGNQLKSAQMALAMWKFLPSESLRRDLRNRVQSEEKKMMEDKMSKLKGMNTDDMIWVIEEILFSSTPKDPALEAALMTVVSKYHFLYPKDLKKYKGKFLWYQALWGKIGDAIYMKHKKNCADAGLPFTEEFLVEDLLKEQVKNNMRRNKFEKDYGGYRTSGLKDELADGEDKTKDFATLDGRIGYCMWEFWNLTYGNGIWGMENVWAKWPDPGYKMNTLPFVILISGMSMDFTQPVINKVKWFAYTTPFSSLVLISKPSELKNYAQYVEKVIELMGNQKMLSEYQALQKVSDRKEKIPATYKFWAKYWAELYPKINMNDGLVLSQKDKAWNEILNWYYNTIKDDVHMTDDFKNGMKKDDIEGWFIDIDNNPIAATGAWFDKISFLDGGKYSSKVSYKYLKMHLDYFKNVISDPTIDIVRRKELFFQLYKKIERHIFSEISWFINRWGPDGYKSYTCVIEARKWWIEVFPEKFTDVNEKFLDSVYDQKLEEKWQEFLRWGNVVTPEVSKVGESTRRSVDDIISQASLDEMSSNAQ